MLNKIIYKNKVPFREFKIKKINEKSLGELFSYFIFETIIIGKLAKIDPFNQPVVEQVKNFTKIILSNQSEYKFCSTVLFNKIILRNSSNYQKIYFS